MPRGRFIVIEGSDGSGKSTQFALLEAYFKNKGEGVVTYHFPQYSEPSSYFVKQYLNGSYGDADSLGAYTPSLFYALDRFQAAQDIRAHLAQGKTVLADRFIGSNMAHQGQKIASDSEREKYFTWLLDLEFTTLGIPKPDLNIVLLVPAEIAQHLTTQREERSYTSKQQDIHEADIDHLRRAVEVYEKLCVLFPKEFTAIQCVEAGKLLPIATVAEKIIAATRR